MIPVARRVAQPPPDAPPVPPERSPKRSRYDTAALRKKVAWADTVFNDMTGTHNLFYYDSIFIEFSDVVYAYAKQMLTTDPNKKAFCRAVEMLPGRFYRIGEGPGQLSDLSDDPAFAKTAMQSYAIWRQQPHTHTHTHTHTERGRERGGERERERERERES